MELRQTNPRRQGDLGEAAAIQALTELGAIVSVPLFHSPDYDLIAEFAGGLARVQVKTSTCRGGSGFSVRLATSGGNRSWTGLVKRFDASRCDLLFVLVADGRRWLIPSTEIEAGHGITLGGPKYSEFELGPAGPHSSRHSRIARGRGSAGVGEPGRSVKSVPRAEWVRFPPPPLSSPESPGAGTAIGRTRISGRHQLTIPMAPFAAAELHVGDAIKVEATSRGRLELTRTAELASDYAAAAFGEDEESD